MVRRKTVIVRMRFAVRFFNIHPTTLKSAERKISKSKEITFNQDEADMLGEDGMAAVANTIAMFRRG